MELNSYKNKQKPREKKTSPTIFYAQIHEYYGDARCVGAHD